MTEMSSKSKTIRETFTHTHKDEQLIRFLKEIAKVVKIYSYDINDLMELPDELPDFIPENDFSRK